MSDTKFMDEPTVVLRLRAVVSGLLEEGAPPAELTYALAYIATEMGIAYAPDSLAAVHVVMQGIASAAKDVTAAHTSTAEPGSAARDLPSDLEPGDVGANAGRTIH
jgi:hypothetical protein